MLRFTFQQRRKRGRIKKPPAQRWSLYLAGSLAAVLAASAPLTHAQTSQTTVVAAPVVAIAIGPTSASVKVGVNPRPGTHTTYVGAPLIAISTPFQQMHIKVR